MSRTLILSHWVLHQVHWSVGSQWAGVPGPANSLAHGGVRGKERIWPTLHYMLYTLGHLVPGNREHMVGAVLLGLSIPESGGAS